MAQGGVIIFEANNADFKNRKRAARACISCQKRKKRCSHTFAKNSDSQAEKDTAEKVLPQLIHKEPVKFVGDLNPESVLTDLTQRSKDSPRFSRIGVWVEQSRLEQEQFRRQQEAAARNGQNGTETDAIVKKAAVQRYSKVERGRRTLTGHQKNYLQAVGALRVLPKATQDALVTTYVACIDPLFPIIDCKRLLQEYANGEASVFLVQAICLVSCKTEEALPYLRLNEDGPLMDPIPFARAIHTGLDAAMKADLEADRFTKVQIMTLMSLHNDGPGGIEESSLHLVMAIHDAQTTGLHINTPGRTRNDQAAMLWWTLWTLDKFNACLGGRPLMIADRDIDIERPVLEKNIRSQTMAVWLAMGDLLDDVIEFYRPKVDPETAGWEKDFPSFEKLTEHCSMDMLGESQRNLLEVCYNIIGILSCRAGGPQTRSYNRRIESADRIQKLTAQGKQAHLPPIPLVPYAISLSLTVAYRGLRDSHCDPVKTQADLAARCDILESLNKTWWTADAMAKLGRKALKSLQLQPENESDRRKSNQGLNAGEALEAEVAPCKFGPFNKPGQNLEVPKRPGATPVSGRGSNGASHTTSSDRLQVLSHAAAQVGETKRSLNLAGLSIQDGTTINPRTANIMSHPNKRPRYNSDNTLSTPSLSHVNTNNFSPQSHALIPDTPPGTTRLSTLSNTPAQTPRPDHRTSFNNQGPANGDYIINPLIDPFCATTDLNPESSNTLHLQQARTQPPIPSGTLSTTVNGTTMAMPSSFSAPPLYNPRMSVPLHHSYSYLQNPNGGLNQSNPKEMLNLDMYNYNELDTLFDGFFDLSMPTMFEDPLFEGAAYDQFSFFTGGNLSGGPSGAGSIDLSFQQQQQQQQHRQKHQVQQQQSQNNGMSEQININMDGMDMDMSLNMSEMKSPMNGTGMNSMSGMNNMSSGQRDLEMNIGNLNARASDGNLAGMGSSHRRNRKRYSSGLMDYDMDMSTMNTMNKISPDGAANHWFWNEDDF